MLGRLRLQEGASQAVEEEDSKDCTVQKRQAVIGLHKPIIMNDAA